MSLWKVEGSLIHKMSDVERYPKMFSDDHRCSWIFSRCSLDVLLMFSIYSKARRDIWKNAFSVQFPLAPGPRIKRGQYLFRKFHFCDTVYWINHCNETQYQILLAQLAQQLNYQMTSTSFLYPKASHANFQFEWWKLQGWEKVFSYLPFFGPNRHTQNNQI